MVRPSNPRLMARVLDAVVNLGDSKGSSARDVLSFIRQSNLSAKNLTVQVRRALKHAVTAGLLRHRSGRYKVLATLNPVSTPAPSAKESVSNDQKAKEKKLKSDIPDSDMKSQQTQERKKGHTSRQRPNTRRSNNTKRKTRRSPSTRRTNATVQNRKRRQRRRKHDDEEFENLSSGRYVLYGKDDESPVSNRRTKRSRVSEREPESDFSDESCDGSGMNRKRVSRANASLHRRQSRYKETCAKSRGKSTSRARTPQLSQRSMQARQNAIEEVGNDVSQYDEDHGSNERDEAHQETHEEDIEEAREPNDSKSDSILENS